MCKLHDETACHKTLCTQQKDEDGEDICGGHRCRDRNSVSRAVSEFKIILPVSVTKNTWVGGLDSFSDKHISRTDRNTEHNTTGESTAAGGSVRNTVVAAPAAAHHRNNNNNTNNNNNNSSISAAVQAVVEEPNILCFFLFFSFVFPGSGGGGGDDVGAISAAGAEAGGRTSNEKKNLFVGHFVGGFYLSRQGSLAVSDLSSVLLPLSAAAAAAATTTLSCVGVVGC